MTFPRQPAVRLKVTANPCYVTRVFRSCMQSETATSSGSGDRPAGISWAWLTAVTLACTVSSLYYAIDRSLAFWRHGPPDPLGAMASPRIDYFWRIALAAFIASIVVFAAARLVPNNELWFRRAASLFAGAILLSAFLSFLTP